MPFTTEELLALLSNVEDSSTERKSRSDKGGWIQTTVAFANSMPIGLHAVLFVGANDNGSIPAGQNAENLMRAYSDVIQNGVYPPLLTEQHVITRDGSSCVAVIIAGSEKRPHFAGKAYIRDGTQTREASEEQFATLIAQRTGKVYKLARHIGQRITLESVSGKGTHQVSRSHGYWKIVRCTQFFVALQLDAKDSATFKSVSLDDVQISYDDKHGQLMLIVER